MSLNERRPSKRYQPTGRTERLVPLILVLLLVIMVAVLVFVLLTASGITASGGSA